MKEDTLEEIDKIKQEAQQELSAMGTEALAGMEDASEIVKEGTKTFQSDVDSAAQAVQESVQKPAKKKRKKK